MSQPESPVPVTLSDIRVFQDTPRGFEYPPATPEQLLAAGFVPQQQLTDLEYDLLDIAESTRGDWTSRTEAGGKAQLKVSALLDQLTAADDLASEQRERATAAADEALRLAELLHAERAKREHLEEAAELLRKCERLNRSTGFAKDAGFAILDAVYEWYDRDQSATPAAPAPSEGESDTCELCGYVVTEATPRGSLMLGGKIICTECHPDRKAEGAKAAEGSPELPQCPECDTQMIEADDVTRSYELRGEKAEWKAPCWLCPHCQFGLTGEHDNDGRELAMERMYARVVKKLEAERAALVAERLDWANRLFDSKNDWPGSIPATWHNWARKVVASDGAQPSPTSEGKDSTCESSPIPSSPSPSSAACGSGATSGSDSLGSTSSPLGSAAAPAPGEATARLDGETGPKCSNEASHGRMRAGYHARLERETAEIREKLDAAPCSHDWVYGACSKCGSFQEDQARAEVEEKT